MCPTNTHIRPRIRAVWSESSLSVWRDVASMTTLTIRELTLNPLGFSPLWFEPRSGHMWESQVLLTDGQVVFLRVLRFSPTFDERSARYKWNILERAVKPKSKKKKKKKLTVPSEDSDQTARIRSLIWIFTGRSYTKVRFVTLRLISRRRLYYNFFSMFMATHTNVI